VRIVHLGFQSRLEAELSDGELVTVQLPRSEALDLGLAPGLGVHLVDASRAVATVG
jgi:hypothetical protein